MKEKPKAKELKNTLETHFEHEYNPFEYFQNEFAYFNFE